MQDPGYDPYARSKIVTRAASSEGGSAAACPANVQKFFKTLLSLGSHAPGLRQINNEMRLCPGSTVASQDHVLDLASRIQIAWGGAVRQQYLCKQHYMQNGVFFVLSLSWCSNFRTGSLGAAIFFATICHTCRWVFCTLLFVTSPAPAS